MRSDRNQREPYRLGNIGAVRTRLCAAGLETEGAVMAAMGVGALKSG